MTRRALAASAALFLVAAAAPGYRWALPAGLSPPVVPADNPMSDAKVALGRRLFYDADLSIDGTMSCATCHEQHRGFADGNATHAGVHGDPGRRNVPGLANVAWRWSYTWGDPRVTTLEAQAAIPQTGSAPVEMGMAGRGKELARRLGADPCYRRMFAAAFPRTRGRIDAESVNRALAAFQRTLVSSDAPIDRDEAPPTGAALFARECASCHAGRDFTDDRFRRLRAPVDADRGLGDVTGRPEDTGAFRTPSLRNVAVTGPWLHDGSATTLGKAVRAHRWVEDGEIPALVSFLDALTDRTFLTDRRYSYPDGICTANVR